MAPASQLPPEYVPCGDNYWWSSRTEEWVSVRNGRITLAGPPPAGPQPVTPPASAMDPQLYLEQLAFEQLFFQQQQQQQQAFFPAPSKPNPQPHLVPH